MSADASVTLTWGDDDYQFRLAIGQLRELQETVNRSRAAVGAAWIGPRTLLRLLFEGDAWPDEIREVLRLGLIGGGKSPSDALALVRRYVDARPLLESAPIARTVLMAALIGVPDDPVGKKTTAGTGGTAPTGSPSPRSTAAARPSD